MTCQPKLRFLLDEDCVRIHSRTADLGTVDLPREKYSVRNAEGEIIAFVNSIEDAFLALLNLYEKENRQHRLGRRQSQPNDNLIAERV